MRNTLRNTFFNITLLAGVMVFFYDIIFELLFEMVMFIFEMFETGLDQFVELIFGTEGRQTEIIVFYIMLCLALITSFWLIRKLFEMYHKFRSHSSFQITYQKYQAELYYLQLSWIAKAKWFSLILASFVCFFMLFL